jgi:hypothetical protein
MKIAHKKGVAKRKSRDREERRAKFVALGLLKPKAKKAAK